MAYPTDFSDVSATNPITASRNNAITKKIGLTAIDTTDVDIPLGHLSLPTLAGLPVGTPPNGVGSLVWNSSANSLHVNTTGSTWATIGGSAAFTEQVTIATGTDPALEVDQTSTGNIVDFQKSGTTKVYITDDGLIVTPETPNGVQFGTDTGNVIRGSDGGNVLYVGKSNVEFYSGSQIRNMGRLRGVTQINQSSAGYGSGLALSSMNDGAASKNQPMTFASGASTDTGDEVTFDFAATINKLTSGNYTGLKLNVTETDVNAGNFLLDLQVGGNTVFNIDTDGVFAINSATPALTIKQTGSPYEFLQLADASHTLTWTKSGNSFLLSHSAGSASIKLQDNSAIVMGGTLQMGTATATGIGFGSHGGIYGYGGSRIHIYPQSGQPLIIGSNTTTQAGLQVYFEAIPVNFLVNVRHHGIAGITASTTQAQGNGALTADINEISTVGSTNDTSTMPTAVAWMRVTVINNGANTMRLYPASGDNLGAGVDTVTTLAADANITYQAYDDTNWFAVT